MTEDTAAPDLMLEKEVERKDMTPERLVQKHIKSVQAVLDAANNDYGK